MIVIIQGKQLVWKCRRGGKQHWYVFPPDLYRDIFCFVQNGINFSFSVTIGPETQLSCLQTRCGLDRQEESLGNKDGSPVPVHGFGTGSQLHGRQVGDGGEVRGLLAICTHTAEKPEGPTKNPRCQNYCVTCRVF